MAYSRFTLNKQEKMTGGTLLVLALIPFLNKLFPALNRFWTDTLKIPSNIVNNTLEDVGMVAIGFTIVKVSKVVPGWGAVPVMAFIGILLLVFLVIMLQIYNQSLLLQGFSVDWNG